MADSALYQLLHRKPPPPGPVRAQPPSIRLEAVAYRRKVDAFWSMFSHRVIDTLRRAPGIRTDAIEDNLRTILAALLDASGLDDAASHLGDTLWRRSAKYIQTVTRLPTVAPRASQSLLGDFRRENLSLIRGVGDDTIDRLADIMRPAQAAGTRWEEVVPQIQDTLDVGKSRARLIARDQTNKFNATATRLGQTGSGIEEYTWQTAGDMAVRGRPGGEYANSRENHWALNGTRQRWDSPPVIPGTSVRSHPGERIQCRCVAIPIIPLFE